MSSADEQFIDGELEFDEKGNIIMMYVPCKDKEGTAVTHRVSVREQTDPDTGDVYLRVQPLDHDPEELDALMTLATLGWSNAPECCKAALWQAESMRQDRMAVAEKKKDK